MGIEFFNTKMGQKFYSADVPKLINAIETVSNKLDELANTQYEYEVSSTGGISSYLAEGWEPTPCTFVENGETYIFFRRKKKI